MKPFLKIMIAAIMLTAVGCAKESGGGDGASIPGSCTSRCDGGTTPPPGTGTGNDPTQTGYYTGSTAQVTNYSGLGAFFYRSMPQRPTNVRVNIDMARAKDSIIISYVDAATNRLVEAGLGTMHPYSGIQDGSYNNWYQENGRWVYKGFFQDQFGAIIVIVNRAVGQGDGQPAQFLGGSIYFQNFNAEQWPNYPIQGPEKMCWQISMGPYDCRSFIVFPGNKYEHVSMTSAETPTTKGPDKPSYYQKLGDFDGIDSITANFPTAN